MSNLSVLPRRPGMLEINSRDLNARREIIRVLGWNDLGEVLVMASVNLTSNSETEDLHYEEEEEEDDDEEEEDGDEVKSERGRFGNLETVRVEESVTCAICLEEISSIEEDEGEEETIQMNPDSHESHLSCTQTDSAEHQRSTENRRAIRIPKPCFHVYHKNCILKWLAKHDTCPLCRYQIPACDTDN